MPAIDPAIGQRISECARALSIARLNLERAKSFEERQFLQREFDIAEQQMLQASMVVNRGIERA